MEQLETDYLVVGAGAAGMAFTDALLTHSDATITLVDRRHAPGGHWVDAYPYVRLHQPSAFYGVDSVPLGLDAVDATGSNAGFYERAGADELRAYFARVMERHFLPTLFAEQHAHLHADSHAHTLARHFPAQHPCTRRPNRSVRRKRRSMRTSSPPLVT